MYSYARRGQAYHVPCVRAAQHEVRTKAQVAQENFWIKF
jgi:hypothetical protein